MKLIKKAIAIGNGAAVYVPREYSGKEIVVILPEGVEEIKQRVLSRLVKYMPNILGVYLYGSYARDEQTENSDIDVFVITREKEDKIKDTLFDIDARVMPIENVKRAIKNYPLLIMPILLEAKPLLNSLLLDELKSSRIDIRKFKWNFEDAERIIKIAKEFIKIDPENIPTSLIYSIFMRIRGCSLMECILENKRFSNEGLKELLIERGISKDEIEEYFRIYRIVRECELTDVKIRKEQILKLIDILSYYILKLKNETKKKTEKRNRVSA